MQLQSAARRTSALSIAEARSMPALINPAAEVQRLELILTPASETETMEAMQFLFKVLPMENAGSTEDEKEEITDALLKSYKFALKGYPRWAIMEARNAFIAGQVDGFTSSFAPRPPDLGREVSRRVDEYRAKLSRVQKQADEARQLESGNGYGPLSAEMRERGARRVAELRAASDAERERLFGKRDKAEAASRPLTMEDLADVPDAPVRDGAMQRMKIPTFSRLDRSAGRSL